MLVTQSFFIIFGVGSGFAVAAGVFALITTLSLLPRMADKTHTGSRMMLYEDCVFLGGICGMAIYFLQLNGITLSLPPLLCDILILFSGLFCGIFVGTLAISIAENLNVTAVLCRRIRLHHGLGFLILSFALGKIFGALLFFTQSFYE